MMKPTYDEQDDRTDLPTASLLRSEQHDGSWNGSASVEASNGVDGLPSHHGRRHAGILSSSSSPSPLSSFSSWRAGWTSLLQNVRQASTAQEKHAASNHAGALRIAMRSLAVFLVPSFLQHRLSSPSSSSSSFSSAVRPQSSHVHATAYLDGLRGFAALFVFFFHFSNNMYPQVYYSFAGPDEDGVGPNLNFLQLPIVKIFYAGPAAVSVFFVVSGFALSIRPVQQMRANDHAGLLSTLQSATFRRPLRLYLPCVISTFISFLVIRTGLFNWTQFIAGSDVILTGKIKSHQLSEGPFGAQFLDWWEQTARMVKLWYWGKDEFQGFYNLYDPHLWTIPIECRASWALFLTHMAVARFWFPFRLLVVSILAVISVHNDRWEMLLFLGGFVLADLNQGPLNPKSIFSSAPARRRFWQAVFLLNFVSGLYLASYPDAGEDRTPGYMLLTALTPEGYAQKRRFWQGIGGMQIVLAVASLPVLSRAFSSPVPRYLGQISFALYLMHALVNHTVGYWMLYLMYNLTDHWSSPTKKAVGFVVALLITLTAVIWAADVFWRFGDRSCVRLAKWLEGLLLNPPARF